MTVKKPEIPDGVLASTFREAMRLSDKMKADGASREERDAFVAEALRSAWPKMRQEPWHYVCVPCSDTGWLPKTCISRSCGRPFKLPGQADDDWTGRGKCQDGHSYVEPCSCAKGQNQRRALMKQPRAAEDAMALAARTTKPTRVGR